MKRLDQFEEKIAEATNMINEAMRLRDVAIDMLLPIGTRITWWSPTKNRQAFGKVFKPAKAGQVIAICECHGNRTEKNYREVEAVDDRNSA